MARTTRIRDNGAIPEKRHDAFLLALLMALALNLAFFAVQALIPTIASLLSLLAPEPPIVSQEPELLPFTLVDPSLLDEDIDPEIPPDAESDRSREARDSVERPDLPEDKPFQEDGVEDIMTFPEGNPGPVDISPARSPGEELPEPGPPDPLGAEEAPPPEVDDAEGDATEDVDAEDQPDAEATTEAPPSLMTRVDPQPDRPPIPESPPERAELPGPPETPEMPEPAAEPDPAEAVQPEEPPLPPSEGNEAPAVEERPDEPEWAEEVVDLAMLPVAPEGFFDPGTQRLEEMIRTAPMPPVPPPERQVQPQPVQPQPPLEMPVREEPETDPRRPRSSRRGRSPVPVREIGQERSGGGAVAGGTPPQQNRNRSVNLLDADPNMRILAHRYGAYMRKVAQQLQESLNRVIVMNPSYYSRGQGKIQFSIAADGSLAYLETHYPADGSNEVVRIISETTVREAAPFEPPTRQMLEDPLFSKMSLTVNLF